MSRGHGKLQRELTLIIESLEKAGGREDITWRLIKHTILLGRLRGMNLIPREMKDEHLLNHQTEWSLKRALRRLVRDGTVIATDHVDWPRSYQLAKR